MVEEGKVAGSGKRVRCKAEENSRSKGKKHIGIVARIRRYNGRKKELRKDAISGVK